LESVLDKVTAICIICLTLSGFDGRDDSIHSIGECRLYNDFPLPVRGCQIFYQVSSIKVIFMTRKKVFAAAFVFIGLMMFGVPPSVLAQSQEEMDILRMIYRDNDLVTSSTRSPKPVNQVAENISVITAEDIKAINAHTLPEVLRQVTGVQVDIRGGVGATADIMIQGSDPRHVQVLVDGISLNNLSENFADIGAFPVGQIARIEIIKGPASSVWGSALGGVINIITRSPDPGRRFGGSASASIGTRSTGDFRADISGTTGSLGYYLYGGGITSDGLTPATPFDGGNLYGKLQWAASRTAHLQLSLAYDKGSRGEGEFVPYDLTLRDRSEYFRSSLGFTYELADNLEAEFTGRVSTKRLTQTASFLSSGQEANSSNFSDLDAGGSAKLSWLSGRNKVIAGADYDNGILESNAVNDGRQSQVKWAFFANDTIALGDFSVTPGVRYDHTSTSGDFVSPSIGVTYALPKQTTVRAYVARGFNAPSLSLVYGDGFFGVGNPDISMEKVWSYTLGVESKVFRYFWLKTDLFLHDVSGAIVPEPLPDNKYRSVNSGRQRRQGVEAELRTVPVHDVSLMGGLTYLEARDRDTGLRVTGVPHLTYNLGIDYRDSGLFSGALRGRFIRWDSDPAAESRDSAMIWDLHLGKKFSLPGRSDAELFFTVHNLFNGSQYADSAFPNPHRWFEGGVKWTF
jgi:vitamin B12 transporter